MSEGGDPQLSRLQSLAIGASVVAIAAVTFGSAGVLAVVLPFWLKPLALVPIVLFARYGAGDTWLESGCVAVMIGGLIAAISAIGSLVKHLAS